MVQNLQEMNVKSSLNSFLSIKRSTENDENLKDGESECLAS